MSQIKLSKEQVEFIRKAVIFGCYQVKKLNCTFQEAIDAYTGHTVDPLEISNSKISFNNFHIICDTTIANIVMYLEAPDLGSDALRSEHALKSSFVLTPGYIEQQKKENNDA